MKKISKEVIDVKNVNVNACLHPHPLMPDSYADIEVEWFSWMPGFDSRDLGDDDEEPLFRDNNILLNKDTINGIKSGDLDWNDLLTDCKIDDSVIEYIDPEEQSFSMIAMKPEEIYKEKQYIYK